MTGLEVGEEVEVELTASEMQTWKIISRFFQHEGVNPVHAEYMAWGYVEELRQGVEARD